MNLRILNSAGALLVLSSVLFGADSAKTPQPGQLASAGVTGQPNSMSPTGSSAVPTSIANVDDPHDRMMNRLWIGSMVAVVAGTSLDAASSWGKRESNPLLAGSSGTFGAKGLGIKAGVAAAVLVPQICLRKHKELRGAFMFGNYGEASIFTAAAIHNLRIRSTTGQ